MHRAGGKAGAAHHLDDAVGKDPAGEAADGENNCAQIRMARVRFGLKEIGLGIGGQDGGAEDGSNSRVIRRSRTPVSLESWNASFQWSFANANRLESRASRGAWMM